MEKNRATGGEEPGNEVVYRGPAALVLVEGAHEEGADGGQHREGGDVGVDRPPVADAPREDGERERRHGSQRHHARAPRKDRREQKQHGEGIDHGHKRQVHGVDCAGYADVGCKGNGRTQYVPARGIVAGGLHGHKGIGLCGVGAAVERRHRERVHHRADGVDVVH